MQIGVCDADCPGHLNSVTSIQQATAVVLVAAHLCMHHHPQYPYIDGDKLKHT